MPLLLHSGVREGGGCSQGGGKEGGEGEHKCMEQPGQREEGEKGFKMEHAQFIAGSATAHHYIQDFRS